MKINLIMPGFFFLKKELACWEQFPSLIAILKWSTLCPDIVYTEKMHRQYYMGCSCVVPSKYIIIGHLWQISFFHSYFKKKTPNKTAIAKTEKRMFLRSLTVWICSGSLCSPSASLFVHFVLSLPYLEQRTCDRTTQDVRSAKLNMHITTSPNSHPCYSSMTMPAFTPGRLCFSWEENPRHCRHVSINLSSAN